jgi:hypothetical protein
MDWVGLRNLVISTVLSLLVASSFLAVVSFGYTGASAGPLACTAAPHINGATEITSLSNEKIVITGTNFCSTKPLWDPFGPGDWLTSVPCSGSTNYPTIQVTDTTAHWAAGRETCSKVDNYGLKGQNSNTPPSWSNTQIIFYGISPGPHFKVGDHIQIEIWSCSQKCHTTYTTTVK